VSDTRLILGQTLAFAADPFAVPLSDAVRHDSRGAVLVADGRIAATGPADRLRAAHPQVPVTDHGAALILPGFVDAHVHYPQTAIIASWGKRLIDWLNTYTFPEECASAIPPTPRRSPRATSTSCSPTARRR
jgi:guanine deaminase